MTKHKRSKGHSRERKRERERRERERESHETDNDTKTFLKTHAPAAHLRFVCLPVTLSAFWWRKETHIHTQRERERYSA